MQNKKDLLIQKQNKWSGKLAPSFNVYHLVPETECADGNNIHNNTKFSSRNDDLLNNEIAFMFQKIKKLKN